MAEVYGLISGRDGGVGYVARRAAVRSKKMLAANRHVRFSRRPVTLVCSVRNFGGLADHCRDLERGKAGNEDVDERGENSRRRQRQGAGPGDGAARSRRCAPGVVDFLGEAPAFVLHWDRRRSGNIL